MSNTASSIGIDETRELVAANLSAELTRQRWSGRKAAAALGLTQPYVARRMSGDVELSASDIVMFASFLDIPVTKFFEGIKKGPKSGVFGPSLPDLDSNQEPAGFAPAPIRLVPRTTTKPLRTMPGVVIPMHRDVSDRDVS
jgi:transcriptional regulator with XRE-family HTH domain